MSAKTFKISNSRKVKILRDLMRTRAMDYRYYTAKSKFVDSFGDLARTSLSVARAYNLASRVIRGDV